MQKNTLGWLQLCSPEEYLRWSLKENLNGFSLFFFSFYVFNMEAHDMYMKILYKLKE